MLCCLLSWPVERVLRKSLDRLTWEHVSVVDCSGVQLSYPNHLALATWIVSPGLPHAGHSRATLLVHLRVLGSGMGVRLRLWRHYIKVINNPLSLY